MVALPEPSEPLTDEQLRRSTVGEPPPFDGKIVITIIDLDLTVPDSADEAAYVPALEAAGYVLRIREPDWYEHRLFKGPDTNVNLHVFSPGSDEAVRHLAFRDWLRSHPEDLDLYARTKRELSAREWESVQRYSEAKDAVVVEILQRIVAQDRCTPTKEENTMSDGKPVADCLFCRIVAGEIPATVVRETDETFAFRDLAPQAPVHVLIVPKAHYANAVELAAAEPALAAALLVEAGEVAEVEGLAGDGYRLAFNTGTHAGQTVFHVHCHLLGGGYLSTFGT